MTDHERWMRLAIEQAEAGMAAGQSPFGAVIVRDGAVLAAAHNTVLVGPDATAHAEVNAVRRACAAAGDVHLRGAVIYSTAEPCPMCFAAIHWADLAEIVYGAAIADAAAAGFNELTISNEQMRTLGGSRVRVTGGVLRAECADLFKRWLASPNARPY